MKYLTFKVLFSCINKKHDCLPLFQCQQNWISFKIVIRWKCTRHLRQHLENRVWVTFKGKTMQLGNFFFLWKLLRISKNDFWVLKQSINSSFNYLRMLYCILYYFEYCYSPYVSVVVLSGVLYRGQRPFNRTLYSIYRSRLFSFCCPC